MISLAGTSASPSATPQSGSWRAHPAGASSTAQQFESILLDQWLQAAESSFGSVPGGLNDADEDGEQIRGFAVQHLADQLAGSGGIGIARMVEDALSKSSNAPSVAQHSSQPQPVQAISGWIPEADTR